MEFARCTKSPFASTCTEVTYSIIQCTGPSQSNLSLERSAIDRSNILAENVIRRGILGARRDRFKKVNGYEFVLLSIACVRFFLHQYWLYARLEVVLPI